MKAKPLTIDDLLPDPRNPRRISDPALAGLQASLRAFGDVSMAWNRRTGEMVSGHQRIAALRQEAKRRGVSLGIHERGDERADIVLPAADGMAEERFNLRIVDWDRQTQMAGNLAANNPGIAGEFTADVEGLLAEVEAGMPELYGALNLDAILEAIGNVPAPSDEDVVGGFSGLSDGDRSPFRQMTFTVTEEQQTTIHEAMEAAKAAGPFDATGNENSNGNALARICESYRG